MQMKEAIERADEALSVMLRLARNGEASCEALRLGLQVTEALKGKLDTFQADSAVQLAAREHRGYSGAGVLATATGLSRRDAAVQVSALQKLAELPEVQQAVEDGRVSLTAWKADASKTCRTRVVSGGRWARLADSLESLTGAGRGDNAASAATGGGKTSADITIVQHLSAEGDRAFAEIAGGDAIPQSVLEEHMCNAHYRGAVFSSQGVPLWQGQHRRLLDQSDRIKRFVSVHQPTTLN